MVVFILVGVCLAEPGERDVCLLAATEVARGGDYDGRRHDSADFGASGFCGARRWVGYLINTTIVTAAQ
jgi:hypothetical protein